MSLEYQTDEDVAQEAEIAARPLIPPPYYTYILVAALVAVALLQFGTGLENSILAAGFDKKAFITGHEYWRILTGATVHGSVPHVLMNCFAFYSFGRIFEMLSNRAHVAIVFLLAAIGGGLLSLIFVPDGLSVGASGGIVGLVSYLTVYAFKRRQFISADFRKSLLINIGFILVFGIVLYRVIDNFGHIGGLITGAVYGLIQIPTDETADPREAGPATEFAGLASLGIVLATCVFSALLILHII